MDLIIYLYLFLLGASIGSFLNVLIDRWVAGESLFGRSHCDKCGHKLAWYDLIPIFSFILLKGRCRYCHKRISFYYPLVELLTGISFAALWFSLKDLSILTLISYLGVISMFIVIFFSDIKYQIITDESQIFLFIFTLFLHLALDESVYKLALYFLAAFVVALPIFGLFLITRGKGMGFGDVKFGLNMGFLLGIKGGLIALYLSFILGAMVGIILVLTKKKGFKSKIPFGPFLVFTSFLLLFFRAFVMKTFYLFLLRYF